VAFDFIRRETPTVMNGRVVRWREAIVSADGELVESGAPNALEISASRDGVMIQGYSAIYALPETRKRLMEVLDEAFEEYGRMSGRR
jgi:hypothetical protein